MADQQASGRDKGKAPQRQQSFSDSEYGQIWGTSMDLGGFEGAPAFTSYEQYYLLQNLGTQITDPHTTSGPEQGTNFDWSSSFPNFPEYNSSSSVQQYVTGIIPSSSEGGLSIPPELQKSEGQSQPWAPILSSTADDSAGPSQHRPKRLKIDHQRPKRPSRSQSSLSTSITPSQTTAVTRPESTFTNPVNDTDNVSVFSGVTDFSQSSYGLTAKLGTVNLNQPPPLLPSIASPNDGSSTPNHAAKSPADFVTGEYACEFPDCDLSFRTKSDFVKHRARHVRPYKCTYPNCKNQQGFANDNELNRHEVSVHKLKSRKGNSKQYVCKHSDCRYTEKLWPRLDNFKQHLRKVHDVGETDIQNYINLTDAELMEPSQEDELHTSPLTMTPHSSSPDSMGVGATFQPEKTLPRSPSTETMREKRRQIAGYQMSPLLPPSHPHQPSDCSINDLKSSNSTKSLRPHFLEIPKNESEVTKRSVSPNGLFHASVESSQSMYEAPTSSPLSDIDEPSLAMRLRHLGIDLNKIGQQSLVETLIESLRLDGILERVIEAGMETLLAQLTGQGSEALRKLSLCDRSGEQDHHTLESLNIAKSLRDLHGLFAPTRRRSADDYKHIHAATSSPFLQPPTINVDPAPDDTVAPEDLNALEVNPPSNLVTCIAGSQPEIQRNGHQQEQSSLRKSKVFKISYWYCCNCRCGPTTWTNNSLCPTCAHECCRRCTGENRERRRESK